MVYIRSRGLGDLYLWWGLGVGGFGWALGVWERTEEPPLSLAYMQKWLKEVMEPWGKRIKISIGSGLIVRNGVMEGQKDECNRKGKGAEREDMWEAWRKKGDFLRQMGDLVWKDMKWRNCPSHPLSSRAQRLCFRLISDHMGSVRPPDRQRQDNA